MVPTCITIRRFAPHFWRRRLPVEGPQLVAVDGRRPAATPRFSPSAIACRVLRYEFGPVSGAAGLARTRAAGAFTTNLSATGGADRHARGGAVDTRALSEVLLGHPTVLAATLTEAMDRTVISGRPRPPGRPDRRSPPRRRPGRTSHPDRSAAPVRPVRLGRTAYDQLWRGSPPVTGECDTSATATEGATPPDSQVGPGHCQEQERCQGNRVLHLDRPSCAARTALCAAGPRRPAMQRHVGLQFGGQLRHLQQWAPWRSGLRRSAPDSGT
jgi:hypothetical protein